MQQALIRGFAALASACAFHAALVAGAACFGWFSPGDVTLPELDLTSVDLSFSETPDEAAAPMLPPPSPAIEKPIPPPPSVAEPPPPPILDPAQPPVAVKPPPPPPVKPLVPPPPPIEPPPHVAEPPSEAEPPPQQQPQSPIEIPPTPAPSQARIAVDKPPAPRRHIKPDYPKGARERGEEGDVKLELDISAAGTVDDVRIVASCGFPELEQAAIQAAKRARFTPARRGSKNVPATASLTLTFRLRGSAPAATGPARPRQAQP